MNMKIWRFLLISAVCVLTLATTFTYDTQAAVNAIARVWEGRTSHAKADGYEKYLNDAGVSQITSATGNLGMQIFRRPTTDAVEFIVISYWQSRDAIKKVVGADIEQAMSLPRDKEFLLEPVTTVRHYQVVYSKYQ